MKLRIIWSCLRIYFVGLLEGSVKEHLRQFYDVFEVSQSDLPLCLWELDVYDSLKA